MKCELIKPIPKYILTKLEKHDKAKCPEQKGLRLYSYLTSIKKELVKITVAVKNYKKNRYCKQVAAHGVKSGECWVKDMEYQYIGMGFRVGWYAEGLTKYRGQADYGKWIDADWKYYNPYAPTVNPEYVARFPEYRYSAYQYFRGFCLVKYLRLYEKYPQTEYLVKLGLQGLHDSVTVLKRIAKDKAFCKWLIANKQEIARGCFYVGAIMQAYKTGKPITQAQVFLARKKTLEHVSDMAPIRELFRKDLENFFSYIDGQDVKLRSYLDYLTACNFLGLDMSIDKNRFPHDFKRWHDIRIDEYHTAKALADEKQRAELYTKFSAVAEKYIALQNVKKGGYAIVIATSPAELMREGDVLKHCVGRMNYDQKMVREETLIFFVRCVETPDVPFVTVEYSPKSKKVLQCYGYDNKRPDTPVLDFVNNVWLPFANKKIKKLSA
jgi:hypothetical protein